MPGATAPVTFYWITLEVRMKNDPPKTSIERKTLARRALPYAKLRLLSVKCVREIKSIRLACAGAQEKKAGKQEGRKKSHMKCIFHVCVERALAGRFQPNLAHVFVSRTLSNVHSFIVIT